MIPFFFKLHWADNATGSISIELSWLLISLRDIVSLICRTYRSVHHHLQFYVRLSTLACVRRGSPTAHAPPLCSILRKVLTNTHSQQVTTDNHLSLLAPTSTARTTYLQPTTL